MPVKTAVDLQLLQTNELM